jgi:hypothetical protein
MAKAGLRAPHSRQKISHGYLLDTIPFRAPVARWGPRSAHPSRVTTISHPAVAGEEVEVVVEEEVVVVAGRISDFASDAVATYSETSPENQLKRR